MSAPATQFIKPDQLVIGVGKTRETFALSEVLYLSGVGNYSTFVRRKKGPVLASTTIGRYETSLPDFIRIHKRFLVNPAFVKELIQTDSKTAVLLLPNGKRLPVARRRIESTRERLLELTSQTSN